MKILREEMERLLARMIEVNDSITKNDLSKAAEIEFPDLIELLRNDLTHAALNRFALDLLKKMNLDPKETQQLPLNGFKYDVPKVISCGSGNKIRWMKITKAGLKELEEHREIKAQNANAAMMKLAEFDSFLEVVRPRLSEDPKLKVGDLVREEEPA